MLRIMCSCLPIAVNVGDDTVDVVGGTVDVVGGTADEVGGTAGAVAGTAGVVRGSADEEVQSLSPILPEPETVCKVCIFKRNVTNLKNTMGLFQEILVHEFSGACK